MSSTSQKRPLPRVFIGSSSESAELCVYLQRELERHGVCEATVWTQGVFKPSGYTMESLIHEAQRSDFAVMLASPDDTISSRGVSKAAARDNVIFELGLFVGALGRERTFIVADHGDKDLVLPSDLNGLTWIPLTRRTDQNSTAAVASAALDIRERIRALGARIADTPVPMPARSGLERDIDTLCQAALAQGWKVRKRSDTTLRLDSRKGARFSLSFVGSVAPREQLREFARDLRAHGLRVNRSIRVPAEAPPAS